MSVNLSLTEVYYLPIIQYELGVSKFIYELESIHFQRWFIC